MQNERIAGVEILNPVWLAEFLAMARIGDEPSTDAIKLAESYDLVAHALREANDRRMALKRTEVKEAYDALMATYQRFQPEQSKQIAMAVALALGWVLTGTCRPGGEFEKLIEAAKREAGRGSA